MNSFWRGRSLALLLATVTSPPLLARPQSTDTHVPVPVDVASIHPHQSTTMDDPSDRRVLPGGRFVATGTSVRTLLRVALMTDDSRILGAPSWIDRKYDITATTADHTEITNPKQFQEFLLSLLETRFQLKFHRDQKEGSVYWLEQEKPGKDGPAMRPDTSGSPPEMSTNSSGVRATMKASGMSMRDIAAALTRQAGRPVEDHTGISGRFSFQIEWAPQVASDSSLPSLFTVVKEQLGLRLRPAKGNLEVFVIDRLEEPSAN